MDAFVEHLQERWLAYFGVAVCSLPLLYVFRQRALPVLLWVLEIVAYMAGVHICLAALVRLARWFKLESTMYFRERVDPGWQIPFKQFWDRSLYKPLWIFYVELVLLIVIVFLVFRYRPLRTQKRMPRRISVQKGLPPHSREKR